MHVKLLSAAALAALLLSTHSPNSEAAITRGACSMSFTNANAAFIGARSARGRFDYTVVYDRKSFSKVYVRHVDVQFTYDEGFTGVGDGGNNKMKFRWWGARDLTKSWVPHNRGFRRYGVNKHMSRTTHKVQATWDLSGRRDKSCTGNVATT